MQSDEAPEQHIPSLGALGGELDRDDLTGPGPENIFWVKLMAGGTYSVIIDYHSDYYCQFI